MLLAGPTADTVVADTTGEDWEADRRRLEGREIAFTAFLEDRGLVLRTDLLRWWGSWITPVFEPRRYDTRFFVAELPEGQVTRDVSTESDEVLWMAVPDVVEAVDEGRLADAAPDVRDLPGAVRLRRPPPGAGLGGRAGPVADPARDAGRRRRRLPPPPAPAGRAG